MAIFLREASLGPLQQVTLSAPSGALIVVVGENGSGQAELLALAAGMVAPAAGSVETARPGRLVGPTADLALNEPAAVLALDYAFDLLDPVERLQAAGALERLRREGATILLATHDLDLAAEWADEVWWIADGRVAAQGDFREVLPAYRRHLAARQRAWGGEAPARLAPAMRRGDGRARIVSLRTLGADGAPSIVLASGEAMTVEVAVEFAAPVEQPVVGIMIRTRIGLEVFGTNTELEGVACGPVAAGQVLTVRFAFECRLCPQEYSITAASHDPDGVWHDWLEDALAFAVSDLRYTAGVANLRAKVEADIK